MFKRLKRCFAQISQCGRLMVGIPNYAYYVERRRTYNPNAKVMSEAEFIAACQKKRHEGVGKCPC